MILAVDGYRMNQSEFKRRRRQLMGMMGSNSVAILPTGIEAVRNRDVHHPFRPDSDFYYLTGFSEPDAVIVLVPGRAHGEFILFCREKDPAKEMWDGRRAGLEGAVANFGADRVQSGWLICSVEILVFER